MMNNFNDEAQYSNSKIEVYKKKFKENIQVLLEQGLIKEAKEMVHEYEKVINDDIDIYSIKGIIEMSEGDILNAQKTFQQGLQYSPSHFDLNYNLAYLYEIQEKNINAYRKYKKLEKYASAELKDEIKVKLDNLLNISNVSNYIKRKKVLIIAYIFPPLGGSGVQRTLKFVKYLRKFGWEPIVVTVGENIYSFQDNSLLGEIPSEVEIIRIDDKENIDLEYANKLIDLYRKVIDDSFLLNKFIEELNISEESLNRLLLQPDRCIVFANEVIEKIGNYINISDVDLIYSTSGPYSDHIIGLILKEKFNKPWVADFRDEWTNNPYVEFNTESIIYSIQRKMEEKIVNFADKIITTTPLATENYREGFDLLPSKVDTITNGYDEDDFNKLQTESKNKKFTIIHNGLLYLIRTPETFLKAVYNLVSSGSIDRKKLKVKFSWTENQEKWIEEVRKFNLFDCVEFLDYVDHKESLKRSAEADVLLLIVGPNKKSGAMYPGKLFEYLRLRKPIISLSPLNGVVDKLIKGLESGYNVDYSDILNIEKVILKLYKKWERNESLLLEYGDEIKNFERVELTRSLVSCFNDLYSRKEEIITSRRKIAFFSIKGGDKFLHDIIRYLKRDYLVKLIIVENTKQIEEGMEWADICWFEWCDDVISYASKLNIAANKRIICRLHRYEVFSDNATKVRWQNVDKLIIVTEHLKTLLKRVVPDIESRVKVQVIENGVDLSKYKFVEREKGYNLAFIGDIIYRKNPFLLIQILDRLVKKDKRYKLFIAGEHKDSLIEEYLNYHINELDLNDHVFFEGWQTNINEWLQDKNYLIAPTIHESFGYFIAEGMACGIKPVIHNFLHARDIWPTDYLFNLIGEAVDMIESTEYNSLNYREYILEHYSLEKQMLKTKTLVDNIFSDEKYEKNILSFKYKEETIYFYLPNQKDYIQSSIWKSNNFYEQGMLEDIYLKDISEKVVIDVGANIGNHTVFFSKISKAKKVYCFEPFKDVYNILKKNIEINSLDEKVKAFNVAVSSIPGKAIIDVVDDTNLGMNKICQVTNGDINVVTLDEVLLDIVDSVDLIKIDVEGMGLDVLYGSTQIIEAFKPDIYIEADTDSEYQKILAFLSKYNYRMVKRYNWTPTYLFTATI